MHVVRSSCGLILNVVLMKALRRARGRRLVTVTATLDPRAGVHTHTHIAADGCLSATPDARRQTPDARRQTPDSRRQTPDARRQISFVLWSKSWDVINFMIKIMRFHSFYDQNHDISFVLWSKSWDVIRFMIKIMRCHSFYDQNHEISLVFWLFYYSQINVFY